MTESLPTLVVIAIVIAALAAVGVWFVARQLNQAAVK